MALTLYDTLGECGYYDGEISLDNVGCVLDGTETRVVLLDYGSVVNAQHLPCEVLQPWLRRVRRHYEKSFQAYKLRSYAKGRPETKQIVENHIENSLRLVDKWIKRKKTSI